MPFSMTSKDLNCPVVYNVEQSVGRMGANAKGDVILMEYLLKGIHAAAAGELTARGSCTPATIRCINQFQADATRSGRNVVVDGRVDRAFGAPETITRTPFAIVLMNIKLKAVNPSAFQKVSQFVPLNAPAQLPQAPQGGGGSGARPGSPFPTPPSSKVPRTFVGRGGEHIVVSANRQVSIFYPWDPTNTWIGNVVILPSGRACLTHRYGYEEW